MEMWPIGKNKNIESNLRMTKWLDLGDKFQAIIFNIFKNSKCFYIQNFVRENIRDSAEYNFSLETIKQKLSFQE